MIQTIKHSTDLMIYHFDTLKLICLCTWLYEHWHDTHAICFCWIRWIKELSHKEWIFWLWLKKTLL